MFNKPDKVNSMAKQYSYTFTNYVADYTIVAGSYDQAKRHVLKMLTDYSVATYNGRWHGEAVKNGRCVAVKAKGKHL
jgi:hypothetical protein